VFFDSCGHTAVSRWSEEAFIPSETNADFSRVERDDPAPPAKAHQVIGRETTLGFDGGAESGHLFMGLNRIEIANIYETSPHGGHGVGVRI